jgi:hypothetical protein
MILTAHDRKIIDRKRTYGAVQHTYNGGTITAQGIADKIGSHVDTVRKRLKTQTPDEIIAEGIRKRGCKPGRKKTNLAAYNPGE